MRYIAILLLTLTTGVCKADSLLLGTSISGKTLSYGIGLEKDWEMSYLSVQSSTTIDRLSSTTTISAGINVLDMNVGLVGGYKAQISEVTPIVGVEFGFKVDLSKKLYLGESNSVTMDIGPNNFNGSMSLGLGINL